MAVPKNIYGAKVGKLKAWVLSTLYWICWGGVLGVFHVAQVLALHLLGEPARRRVADVLNGALLLCLRILAIRPRLEVQAWPPQGRPLIVVANHQNPVDISGISWLLRAYQPAFVAKQELARSLPSVSYNLRHSGAALIDRKDARQSLREIARLGRLIAEEKRAAVIFPEGTRAKDGQMKAFAGAGVKTLLKNAPDALLVPICIDGAWRMNATGLFPLCLGHDICWRLMPAIDPAQEGGADAALEKAERAIRSALSTSRT